MSYYYEDEYGHIRDRYGNYKDSDEVRKAVNDGVLKYFDCDRKAYNPKTGEEFWADGTKR